MKDSDYGELLHGIGETTDEGILMFKIDPLTIENVLVYANGRSMTMLEMVNVDESSYTMELLFGMSTESVRRFVHEKLLAKHLNEERIIYFDGNKSSMFNMTYHVFESGPHLLMQVFLGKLKENAYLSSLNNVEANIETTSFSKGYIALFVLKNQEAIVKSFGLDTIVRIHKIISRVIVEKFNGKVDLYSNDQSYLISIPEDIIHPQNVFNDIIIQVRRQIFDDEINVLCDIKVGVSTLTDNKYTALHEAKYSLYQIFTSDESVGDYVAPSDEILMDYVIKNDLPYAIRNDELSVVFQGIYDIQEPSLYGFEVLLRWHHNKYGNISPANFIPVAERTDMITKLDLWMVERALHEFDALDYDEKKKLKLNFNISPRDFFDNDFVNKFIELIDRSSIEYKNVILELTETLNLHPKRSSIEMIKDKGIMVALDDFGTGFSSLSQLKNYNIDFLKIDISFISDINKNYDNTLITNAILALAKNLDINVIAEGVESTEQISFLKKRDCGYVQGFGFHRPAPLKEIKDALNEQGIGNVVEDRQIPYRDYVSKFPYGRIIYSTISQSGVIVKSSDLLNKKLGYNLGEGENISNIIVEPVQATFMMHLSDAAETGNKVSFMTELISAHSSIPVSILMALDDSTGNIDLFIEDYEGKQELYEKTRNIYNRYDLIFKKVNVALIVYDTNMVIQEWNKQAVSTFGLKKREAIGKNLPKLLFDRINQEKMDLTVTRTLDGSETEVILASKKNDGRTIICNWRNIRLTDEFGEIIGIISWVVDVTEQLEAERELNALSTIVKQDPAGIVLTDLSGKIVFVNEAFSAMTGYEFQEVIGKDPSILSSGLQSKELYATLWNTITRGDLWEGEFANKRKDGSIYVTESRIFPIKNDKNVITYFSCIQKDITKEIEKDNLVNEINTTLENQERLSMIGQMAAGIMHEINNPLSFIDINVHALSDMLSEIEHENNQDILDELFDLANDLKEGIDSIKSIAAGLKRFTYRSQSNEFESIDLNTEINTIAAISKNEYKYYCDLAMDMGDIPCVMGDAGKIKQVILNLIINAVHAIRERSEHLRGLITITTYEETEYVCCDIKDTGTGIPVEVQNKIFDSFFTTKKAGKGSGLGLSLSKKIIEKDHKGVLSFVTTLGEGTTFTIKLQKISTSNDE